MTDYTGKMPLLQGFVMKKSSILLLFLLLLWMNPLAVAPAVQVVEGINPSVPFSHALWDATLAESVSADGWIDFSYLKAHPRVLNAYLKLLAQVSPETMPALFKTPKEKAAYWVNAYNALLLRLTLDGYPTETAQPVAKQLPQLLGYYRIGGCAITLETLKAKVEESGGTAGINVSALLSSLTLAGPILHNEAYTATKLSQQAQVQAKQPQPYALLRQETEATCNRWIIQYIDRKKGTWSHYKPNARLPIEFPLPVPRPMLETTVPYSDKALFHYCLNPVTDEPPSPLLLMDTWQLVP